MVNDSRSLGVLTILDPTTGSLRIEMAGNFPGRYQEFYRNVAETIRGEAQLIVTPTAAATVVRLLELCQWSARERRSLDVNF